MFTKSLKETIIQVAFFFSLKEDILSRYFVEKNGNHFLFDCPIKRKCRYQNKVDIYIYILMAIISSCKTTKIIEGFGEWGENQFSWHCIFFKD